MFCYQCEQKANDVGCDQHGVCGKNPKVAALQDLLIHATKGIAMYAHRARKLDVTDPQVDRFVLEALFTTVTNVNFDPEDIAEKIRQAVKVRDQIKQKYENAADQPETLSGPADFTPADDVDGMVRQGREVGVLGRREKYGRDINGLREMATYGLKGMAAYADHALLLGQMDDSVLAFFHEALDKLTREDLSADDLLGLNLKIGEVNLTVMGLLDAANTGTYGHPEPTEVRVTPVAGKCILVSGHDLHDLAQLLEQTQGKGINVYTHGEMLPCLAYPELKKYDHLVGNYGGAWQDQQREFADFPGAILMTTNCIQRPQKVYQERIFTTGLVAWPGVGHITPDASGKKDFSPVIRAAQEAEGFAEDAPEKTITIGFARNAVLGVADTVVQAVKNGDIRHFFLVGGCDGAKTGRNYYTEFAEQVPDDCVILTLACGKYRFNKMPFGEIGGIPRLLDCGQCNDAYSAIQIALALADAFDCGVNDLPLSLVLSWYEQKAVVILLTLLHLGIENMRLGPSLPAFITSDMLGVLVDKFKIKPISTPQQDLAEILD
ncbi:MAG: hydroxylamine reductase [Phycisphaerae bacterium]